MAQVSHRRAGQVVPCWLRHYFTSCNLVVLPYLCYGDILSSSRQNANKCLCGDLESLNTQSIISVCSDNKVTMSVYGYSRNLVPRRKIDTPSSEVTSHLNFFNVSTGSKFSSSDKAQGTITIHYMLFFKMKFLLVLQAL